MPLYLVLKVTDHPDDSLTREMVGEHQATDAGVALARADEHARNLAQADPAHAYDVAVIAHRFVGHVRVERRELP